MSLEISGKLHAKFPTQQIKDNFSKREFVLELTEESPTGMVYTNYASFQLLNATCAILDSIQEGEVLTVSFNLRGNRWERDGQVKYITNLNAWRVVRTNGQPIHVERVGESGIPAGGLTNGPRPQQQPAPQAQGQANGTFNNQPDDLPF